MDRVGLARSVRSMFDNQSKGIDLAKRYYQIKDYKMCAENLRLTAMSNLCAVTMSYNERPVDFDTRLSSEAARITNRFAKEYDSSEELLTLCVRAEDQIYYIQQRPTITTWMVGISAKKSCDELFDIIGKVRDLSFELIRTNIPDFGKVVDTALGNSSIFN